MAAQGKEKGLRRGSVRGKKIPKVPKLIEVELPEMPPCPECGIRGVHYCSGKNHDDESVVWIGVRKKA